MALINPLYYDDNQYIMDEKIPSIDHIITIYIINITIYHDVIMMLLLIYNIHQYTILYPGSSK